MQTVARRGMGGRLGDPASPPRPGLAVPDEAELGPFQPCDCFSSTLTSRQAVLVTFQTLKMCLEEHETKSVSSVNIRGARESGLVNF